MALMSTRCYGAVPRHAVGLHVLSLFNVKQILALHGLLQQGSVLEHQGLDLAEQVAILFLQVALQLAQQLNVTQAGSAHVSITTNRTLLWSEVADS